MGKIYEMVESKEVGGSGEIVLLSKTGGRYGVDKMLFQQVSAYYQALISSGMKDSHFQELSLEYLSDNCLLEVREYLSKLQTDEYERSYQFSMKLLNEVEYGLEGATYLQISRMTDEYLLLLMGHLKDSTWVHILDFVTKLSLNSGIEKVLHFVCENFDSLKDQPDILALSADELFYLVRSELVDANSEFDVFSFAIRWISADHSRRVHADKLLAEINYRLMTAVEKEKVDEVAKQLNLNVCQTECSVKFRRTIPVVLALARSSYKGFHDYHFQALPVDDLENIFRIPPPEIFTIYETSPVIKFKCIEKQELTNIRGFGHGVCELDNCLYVAGGQVDESVVSDELYVFNVFHSTWSKCSKMNFPRSLFYFGQMNGHLYAVAGSIEPKKDTRTVEKYIPKEDRWCMLAPLFVSLHEMSGCVDGSKLYVSGGSESFTEYQFMLSNGMKSVWQYDAENDRWQSLAPLLVGRRGHSMRCIGNKLLVIGGAKPITNHIYRDMMDGEVYDFETMQWTSILKLKMPACCSPLVLIDKCLYLIGGHSFQYGDDNTFIQLINFSKHLKGCTDSESAPDNPPNDDNHLAIGDSTSKLNKSNSASADEFNIYEYGNGRKFFPVVHIVRLARRHFKQFVDVVM
ncbi:hypothetical protein HELRODRAFT_189623 [Helobdella robusta]|uniref:BACK domain-containing protein n=1 Tax=Helobdella robusta TaxID=6412 RepID=T1FR77_HELRO|nr:hypothetical protein HELRODRAFT_189623 [Helobdella robusta]ESN92804.1 hypothetical protein HELRODRAFT_189623 [Helobdella robusta]